MPAVRKWYRELYESGKDCARCCGRIAKNPMALVTGSVKVARELKHLFRTAGDAELADEKLRNGLINSKTFGAIAVCEVVGLAGTYLGAR